MHSVLCDLQTRFTKDFLKEMEAGDKKWTRKGTQRWTQKRIPLGSPGAQKHKEFKGFWCFLASQRGPVFSSFVDPLWVQFGDGRIWEFNEIY